MSSFGKKGKQIVRKADILNIVSPYDIYRYYFGPFKLNHVCTNHLRGERDASFIIGNKTTSELSHKDFGDMNWRGDCFNLVEQIYQCDFEQALALIDRDMKLGILTDEIVERSPVVNWKVPTKIEAPPPPDFKVSVRPFTKEELSWWSRKYTLDKRDLKAADIYAPRLIWRNKKTSSYYL